MSVVNGVSLVPFPEVEESENMVRFRRPVRARLMFSCDYEFRPCIHTATQDFKLLMVTHQPHLQSLVQDVI